MGLENATTIAELNAAWPLGTDWLSQGDDHVRLLKAVLQGDAVDQAQIAEYLALAGGTMTGALELAADPVNDLEAATRQYVDGEVAAGVGNTFHDATGAASWQILGNTLECWGMAVVGSQTTIVLPKSFANVQFTVVATAQLDGFAAARAAQEVNKTARTFNSFQLTRFATSNGDVDQGDVSWRAVGEWDGVS